MGLPSGTQGTEWWKGQSLEARIFSRVSRKCGKQVNNLHRLVQRIITSLY